MEKILETLQRQGFRVRRSPNDPTAYRVLRDDAPRLFVIRPVGNSIVVEPQNPGNTVYEQIRHIVNTVGIPEKTDRLEIPKSRI